MGTRERRVYREPEPETCCREVMRRTPHGYQCRQCLKEVWHMTPEAAAREQGRLP